jgi:RNA polymerase sigma-70 factor (ECF subfamily)
MNEAELRGELERMHRASFGWALWCCHSRRDEAEEVLQTTYLKVLEGAATFEGESSLRTWLFAVIRRTAAERRRRQWLRGQIFERWLAAEPSPPPAPDPEIVASRSENRGTRFRSLSILGELPTAVPSGK